ncbi:hypothetical protein, partial [Burkholderia ubonensis]|uniref:hypothetical protein n=1 Tax=Burkholderia ubonensis TaxID=101571 RepID=UPI001E3BA6F7
GRQPPIPSFRKWLVYAKLFLGRNTRQVEIANLRVERGDVVFGEERVRGLHGAVSDVQQRGIVLGSAFSDRHRCCSQVERREF